MSSSESETSRSGRESDSDTLSETSSDESDEKSTRKMSGQRSDDSDTDTPDIKDQLIIPEFKPKPVMSTVTKFARQKLRGAFLGLPIGKDERKAIVERYYCCPGMRLLFWVKMTNKKSICSGDYREFSAPSVQNSHLLCCNFQTQLHCLT